MSLEKKEFRGNLIIELSEERSPKKNFFRSVQWRENLITVPGKL